LVLDSDPRVSQSKRGLREPLRISHVAALVPNIEATIQFLGELLGWGPWSVYQLVEPRLGARSYRGNDGTFGMIGAETHLHEIDFALNEAVTGPSIYSEYLVRRDYGLHHIACMAGAAGLEAVRRRFDQEGIGIAMAGCIDATIDFMYFDTEPQLGVAIESGTGHAISLKPDRQLAPPTRANAPATLKEIALVVDDVDRAIRSFTRILGWSPWRVHTESLRDAQRDGSRVRIEHRVARTHVAPITIALVQPTVGPSAEAEGLQRSGNGLQHIACELDGDERDRVRDVLRTHDVATIISGHEGPLEVWYLDTTPRLKLLFR
jgi:catechol 2,3-dioxygenase-like lactoylglutathione lyase family enzyme